MFCSSTKIYQGIINAREECQSFVKPDRLKTRSSLLGKSTHVPLGVGTENELNQTLIPDSEDEEDMVVDTEDIFLHMPSSVPRVATVTDLYQLFQDVWYIIYIYTCRYAVSLGLDMGNNLPKPDVAELPPDLQPKLNFKHLNQLTNGVIQLAKYLNE